MYRFSKIILLTTIIFLGFYDVGLSVMQDQDTVAQQADTTVIVGPVQIDTTQKDTVNLDTTRADTSSNLDQVGQETGEALSEIENLISVGVILAIIIALIITYFLNRFVVVVLENLSEQFTSYRLGIKRMVPVVRLVIWIFAIYIIIAGIINPPLSTIITVLASVGIAVGFAAQDILKNIFGGFIIIMDRPFQVGDKIQVAEHYGEVLSIGLRSSRIVTPDDSVVTIPNSELMNTAVSNSNSSALDCQVVAEIFLPMNVDVDTVKRIAYRAAVSSRYVYLQKPVAIIALNEVHEENFVLKLRVKAYVLDIRYEFPFKSDMTELILSELKERDMLPKQKYID
ncbi:mechanosensitive ion channel family protein [Fodinibius sp.]|uniref:mechanosensitive ion channel family protein n=1 Tax=Fodinibius sp. TaxID=1872440 RepID=UPI002ACEA0C7|nr:mechanosensitive ion channel domain-containing protein [Fodinibius sp.]MDZ7657860.1 mechanosensitive ion channel [Fodinibius sp.]